MVDEILDETKSIINNIKQVYLVKAYIEPKPCHWIVVNGEVHN